MAGGSSSWKDEAIKRITTVKKLRGECMKYVQSDSDSLAKQTMQALLKTSSLNNDPVKLVDIAESIYGQDYKDKLDVVRLTMEKTLVKCGIVDKIYFSDRDVRYFPVAYRFQEVSRVETGSGAKIEQLIGQVVSLPREYWPVPGEYFELMAARGAVDDALQRLEEDHRVAAVDEGTYDEAKRALDAEGEDISKRLKQYADIAEAMK